MLTREERRKRTYETLCKTSRKQFWLLVIAIVIIYAVITAGNAIHLNVVRRNISALNVELRQTRELNEASEPIVWENRESERILRDEQELDRLFGRMFTFRTLEDMLESRQSAVNAGFSQDTVQALYDPDEIIFRDMLTEGDAASRLNTFYLSSEIFLIETHDDAYRYLTRVLLDISVEYPVTVILFIDVDEDGQIVNDFSFFGTLPSSPIFR
jgi:cell division protein FtsL